jgi:hypothetical protein
LAACRALRKSRTGQEQKDAGRNQKSSYASHLYQ